MADDTQNPPALIIPEPWYQDGKYGRDPLRVSPEGFVYGQMTRYVEWPHEVWWDGERYREVTEDTIDGTAASVDLLPAGPRPFGEIWKARRYVKERNEYVWDTHFWDSEHDKWELIKWYWNVDAFSDLPNPGLHVGAGHLVREPDVLVFWDGFKKRRPRHSSLDNDERELHLPEGFLQIYAPDVRVVYVGPREIGLEAVLGGSGQVWVNGEWIKAQKSASVLNSLAVIDCSAGVSPVLSFSHVEPDTEYWIYLANTADPAFVTTGLAGDEDHNAAPAWDYRGKMFLSNTPNVDGYLSDEGSGRNARLVGKIQTDETPAAEGGPFFIREIGISLVSQTANFAETFRGYSDYQVQFVDQDTLVLKLLDGHHGMLAINRDLYYLGADYDIDRTAAWIDWVGGTGGSPVIRHTEPLMADKLYYIYIPSRIDDFNFNAINPNTQRPWQATDDDSQGNYDAELDLRLKPFLSPKTQEHGRMSDQWPGYEARHIGQVRTDANGRFIPARDLSAIRQPSLNPVDFDGLAEIRHEPGGPWEFMICTKRGTSGIVVVGGEAIQTYEATDANVHRVTNTDPVYSYEESELTAPLTAGAEIKTFLDETLYLYLANNRAHWGDLAGKVFMSDQSPTSGYLSRNWPGNQARWVATIKMDANGNFTGSYLIESIATVVVTIDDNGASLSEVWSSEKVAEEFTTVWAELNATKAWDHQVKYGLAAKIVYETPDLLRFVPTTGQDVTIIWPDMVTKQVLPAAGVTMSSAYWDWLTPYTTYYLYIRTAYFPATLQVDPRPPTWRGEKLSYLDTGSEKWILIGYMTVNASQKLGGEWSVYSCWHQNARNYSANGGVGTVYLNRDALLVPPWKTADLWPEGESLARFWCNGVGHCWARIWAYPASQQCIYQTQYVHVEGTIWSTRSHGSSTLQPGVYRATDLWCAVQASVTYCYCGNGCSVTWDYCNQSLALYLPGT